jgi:hypothetical protein
MGCDIHCYIQYKKKTDDDKWWWTFGGKINPGRNYAMFGVLAGVRYRDIHGSFSPKGILPTEKQSWKVRDDLYLYITEDGKGENETTLENAQRWFGGREILLDQDGKPWMVRHPDWHSHSWMTIEELQEAYKSYKKYAKKEGYNNGVPLEYKVILKMMKALENEGENEVLLVFWFDN